MSKLRGSSSKPILFSEDDTYFQLSRTSKKEDIVTFRITLPPPGDLVNVSEAIAAIRLPSTVACVPATRGQLLTAPQYEGKQFNRSIFVRAAQRYRFGYNFYDPDKNLLQGRDRNCHDADACLRECGSILSEAILRSDEVCQRVLACFVYADRGDAGGHSGAKHYADLGNGECLSEEAKQHLRTTQERSLGNRPAIFCGRSTALIAQISGARDMAVVYCHAALHNYQEVTQAFFQQLRDAASPLPVNSRMAMQQGAICAMLRVDEVRASALELPRKLVGFWRVGRVVYVTGLDSLTAQGPGQGCLSEENEVNVHETLRACEADLRATIQIVRLLQEDALQLAVGQEGEGWVDGAEAGRLRSDPKVQALLASHRREVEAQLRREWELQQRAAAEAVEPSAVVEVAVMAAVVETVEAVAVAVAVDPPAVLTALRPAEAVPTQPGPPRPLLIDLVCDDSEGDDSVTSLAPSRRISQTAPARASQATINRPAFGAAAAGGQRNGPRAGDERPATSSAAGGHSAAVLEPPHGNQPVAPVAPVAIPIRATAASLPVAQRATSTGSTFINTPGTVAATLPEQAGNLTPDGNAGCETTDMRIARYLQYLCAEDELDLSDPDNSGTGYSGSDSEDNSDAEWSDFGADDSGTLCSSDRFSESEDGDYSCDAAAAQMADAAAWERHDHRSQDGTRRAQSPQQVLGGERSRSAEEQRRRDTPITTEWGATREAEAEAGGGTVRSNPGSIGTGNDPSKGGTQCSPYSCVSSSDCGTQVSTSGRASDDGGSPGGVNLSAAFALQEQQLTQGQTQIFGVTMDCTQCDDVSEYGAADADATGTQIDDAGSMEVDEETELNTSGLTDTSHFTAAPTEDGPPASGIPRQPRPDLFLSLPLSTFTGCAEHTASDERLVRLAYCGTAASGALLYDGLSDPVALQRHSALLHAQPGVQALLTALCVEYKFRVVVFRTNLLTAVLAEQLPLAVRVGRKELWVNATQGECEKEVAALHGLLRTITLMDMLV